MIVAAQGWMARIAPLVRVLVALTMVALAFMAASPASAQVTTRYTNTSDSATGFINENNTPCSNPYTRTFTVGSNYTISDVNIGVLLAHTYRGDLLMWLVSPSGTRIQLASGDGAGADNYNVLFDDSAASAISSYTANATATAGTTVPPYAATYRPASVLSGFNGQSSAGTWTLEICDRFNGDSGTFYQADLYLTSTATNYADLSLNKTLLTSNPTSGSSATFRLTVTNAATSPQTATGIEVRDMLPTGFSFTGSNGSYNSSTGIWSVGSLAPGASASIDITGTVNASAGGSFTNTAEIVSSSVPDIDSTPDNGVTSEDDYASATLTVSGTRTAGVPPTLTCPAGFILFDWDLAANDWAAGTTSNNYTLGAIGQIQFLMQNPGTWLNNASVGGQSPTRQAVVHGATFENSVLQLVDLPDRSSVVTTTITLPAIMRGAQFRIFDVDYANNQFADRMEVEGRYQGATVIPILTNGVSNYVVGNQAFGDAASNNDSADGNITVTFNAPIDTIIIRYGNHSLAPTNPGQQGIAIHDINFCRPTTSITAIKTSSVISDPVTAITGGTPKAIPGATVRYCLLFTNTGDTAAVNISASDTLPGDLSYTAGTLKSGTSCSTAAQAEDDDSSGADESDPHGAASTGTVVTASATSLAAGATYAVTFEMTVD